MNSQELGLRIQARREALDLSQADLASLVGVKQQQVSKWETGVAVPSARMLPMLSHALGLPSGELYQWVAEAGQEEINKARRDRDRALAEMKRFSDTYKQFHAAYETMGTDVALLKEEIAELKRLIVERLPPSDEPGSRRGRHASR